MKYTDNSIEYTTSKIGTNVKIITLLPYYDLHSRKGLTHARIDVEAVTAGKIEFKVRSQHLSHEPLVKIHCSGEFLIIEALTTKRIGDLFIPGRGRRYKAASGYSHQLATSFGHHNLFSGLGFA